MATDGTGAVLPSSSRSAAREEAILNAALELIVEVGYDRLSMDALAERARASKATIYRHWEGKAEVVVAAIRARKGSGPSVPDTGSLRGDLMAQLARKCQSVSGEEGALMGGLLLAMRGDPVLAELMRAQVLDSAQEPHRVIAERAMARGEIPATADVGGSGEVMQSMIFMRLLVSGQALDEQFVVHLVDDIVIPLLRC